MPGAANRRSVRTCAARPITESLLFRTGCCAPAAAVSEVAKLAKIPPENRTDYCTDLTAHVVAVRLAGANWERWKRSQLYKWLAPIANQASTLRDSLSSLSVDERNEIEKLILIGAKDTRNNALLTFHTIQAFLGALDAIAELGKELVAHGDAEATSASRPPRQPGTRGPDKKPLPWSPGASAPEELVAALYRLATRYGGKLPTFTSNNVELEAPAGTLLDALELLRPHLPNGFLDSLTPKVLRKLNADLKPPKARVRPKKQKPGL